uniref:Uncharacterized protein n=1 Tax=Rhizophora mucronata TaxID=61149 RepID=A0A2P2N2C6_RHIMU
MLPITQNSCLPNFMHILNFNIAKKRLIDLLGKKKLPNKQNISCQ